MVAYVRKALGLRKAGHGGTLDPLATGVLPVYLGEGTKLVPFNLEGTKEYRGTMRLGQETDTLDAEGRIVAEKEDFRCTVPELEEVLRRYRGRIRQVPPLYSALKLDGLPLYKRARAGENPPVPEREVVVHELVLERLELPFVTLRITCGRGTYVRSLCAAIGRDLGCGAHLTALRRLRSGRFTLEQASGIDSLHPPERERIGEKIVPLKDGVEVDQEIRVSGETARRILQGRSPLRRDLSPADRDRLQRGQRVSLVQEPDRLLAIAEAQADGGLAAEAPALRILRVFHG